MHYLNIFLAFLAFLAWLSLFLVYYRDRVTPWFINTFTRDKPPKMSEENSLFGKSNPLPFQYTTPQTPHELTREKEAQRIKDALEGEKEATAQEDPSSLPDRKGHPPSHSSTP